MITHAHPPESPARRRRGLFDATLMLLLLYAVWAKTPCGALPVYAWRKAHDQPTPNLLATFTGRETAVDIAPRTLDVGGGLLASETFPAPVAEAAKLTGADAEVLVSLLSANHESCTDETCVITAPPRLGQALEAYDAREKAPLLDVARGLAAYQRRLGGDPLLGLEALYVGDSFVSRAVEQARASGLDDAEDVEVHAAFYSSGIRRGALQGALTVLALHRLRTLAWPADKALLISSPFGERMHPVLKQRRFHNGTDIAAPVGQPLFAAHDGVILRAGRDSVSGNFIKIDHGFSIETTYCHLSIVDVDSNSRVDRGQTVGRAGATGRVTGPHLHYILRVNDKEVDAEMYGESPSRKQPSTGS